MKKYLPLVWFEHNLSIKEKYSDALIPGSVYTSITFNVLPKFEVFYHANNLDHHCENKAIQVTFSWLFWAVLFEWGW